jgi:transposase
MYRIAFTDEQRREVRRRTRQAGLAPSTRDRLEMVRLSDAGWGVPRIARHLGQHEQAVRAWVTAFLTGGVDALPDKPRGGKTAALTAPMLGGVRAEVAKGTRTWTAAQLADWVAAAHGVRLRADRLRRHLRRARLSWPRTSRTLRHKREPIEVAAREAVLRDLAKKGTRASPTGATWTRRASP